ncbi:MAG: hypothetical protein MH825_05030 [Cyanobacteria bacterium]|nr:hypothetical protein [Cyanobacteriota bacterium]
MDYRTQLYEFIRVDPCNPFNYIQLAEVLDFLGKKEASAKSYSQANALDSESLDLRSKINWLNVSNKNKSSEEILSGYDRILHGQEVALYFSPDVSVLPHFSAQCVVAKTLQEQGIQSLFLNCSDLFYPFLIPSTDAIQDWFKSENIQNYKNKVHLILKSYLKEYDLVDIYPNFSVDIPSIDNDLKLFLHQNRNFLGYEYDGVAFGKLALLDLSLLTKKIDFSQASDNIQLLWFLFIKNNIIAYQILRYVYLKLNVKYAFHYGDYSLMLTHRIVAQLYPKVSLFSISHPSHLGVDRQRYAIYRGTFRETALKQGELWPSFRDLSLTQKMVLEVGDDLIARLSSAVSHIYSPAKTIGQDGLKKRLGLDDGKYLVVAYTSSLDEYLSAKMSIEEGLRIKLPNRSDPFKDQIDWLKKLVSFFESHDNIKLLVRVHPRESKNKRDSVVSEHLQLLMNEFSGTFHNSHFIWPEDPVSSYDVAELADLVLTSWSSIGLECARLGVPVLTAIHGMSPFPHDDFLEWEETPTLYFQKLQYLIDQPASTSTIARAFRCYYLYQLGASLDFSDVVPNKDFSSLPEFLLGKEAKTLHDAITSGQDLLEINYNHLKVAQSPNSFLVEEQEIIHQLRRIFHFIFTGQDDFPKNNPGVKFQYISQCVNLGTLVNCAREQGLRIGDQVTAFVGQHDKEVFYIAPNGQALHRYSPLCTRLIPLIC